MSTALVSRRVRLSERKLVAAGDLGDREQGQSFSFPRDKIPDIVHRTMHVVDNAVLCAYRW